ncbi:cytochrome c [Dyella choica]|uniref:Cytochrome c n=2 Tax=Dyella choica TaxID=1927959 RepID=A0A432MA84_9GAMM|nr:cytochrome c [Dyella choica]
MFSKRRIAGASAGIVVLGAILYFALAWHPAMAPVSQPDVPLTAGVVSQGQRIAELGDCVVCHTGPAGARYAGGLPLRTPFGTLYTTNITPDRETGIGNWSLQAFRRAMREGVARDGQLLYPAFPYIHYTHVTDDDLKALYAFLMTRGAVHAPARSNELLLPLRFRPMLAFWNLLYVHEGPRPSMGASPVERGRYLVEGLGHCSSCHTPLNLIGGEKGGDYLGGGEVDGWSAPPLDALLGAPQPWTQEQLVAYLSTGLATEHGAAAGPMRPVVENLSRVPREDVEAIAAYLFSIQNKAVHNAAAQPEASAALANHVSNGKTVFEAACATCHGSGSAMSAYEQRPPLALSSAFNGSSEHNAVLTVLQGLPWPSEPGVTTYMPAFADVLTDAQIADVVTYLRVSAAGRPAWPDVNKTVANLRKESSP